MFTKLQTTTLLVLAATTLTVPGVALGQTVEPLDCLPGSTGPTVGDPTPFGGGMCDLGSLRADNLGYSYANAVSADGGTIVGWADTDDGNYRAFRWMDDGTGMLDLGSLRADNLGYSYASAVSADGGTIVGAAETDDGNYRAFIWRTQMQDLENLMLSFPILANDTEIAVAQQQGVVGHLMDETCLAEEGQSCMRVGGWLSNTGATGDQNIGERTSTTATLTYGYGLDGRTTLGGTLSLGGTNLSSNGFDMGTALGLSLWGEYSESGLARTGWQASAALGWGRESGDISRGRGLENVLLSTGNADLETLSARASLGYGFDLQNNWLVTPSLTLAHYRTTRDGYAETGGDFNATYDRLTMDRTTLTLGVDAEHTVSEQGTLLLGLGIEHDLSADRATLTGTSDMPGMESFSVSSTLERRDTRGYLSAGYTHDLGNDRTVTGRLQVGQSAFGDKPQVGLGIHYGMRF